MMWLPYRSCSPQFMEWMNWARKAWGLKKTFCVRCVSFTSITIRSINKHLTTISIGLATISPVLSGAWWLLYLSAREAAPEWQTDIISNGFLHSALSRTNKSTYGNHVRNVGHSLSISTIDIWIWHTKICHLLKLTRLTGRTIEISLPELRSSIELKYRERTSSPIQKVSPASKVSN